MASEEDEQRSGGGRRVEGSIEWMPSSTCRAVTPVSSGLGSVRRPAE